MRIDLQGHHVDMSVRELVAPPGAVGTSRFAAARARLGQHLHERFQQQRAWLPGFEAERPLTFHHEIDGFAVRLRGRADAVYRSSAGVLVEELKSVVHADELDTATLRQRDALQVQLYALCLDDVFGEDLTLRARVRLIAPRDSTGRCFEVAYRRDSVLSELDRRLRAWIALAERAAERAAERRRQAEALCFPFAAPRPHQQELMTIFSEGLENKRPVMAAAPTGIGKTVCALLPAMRHALSRGSSLMFLTAKLSQQQHVAATFEHMVDKSKVELHALTMAARERMCPPGDLRCHPNRCPLLDGFDQRARELDAVPTLLEQSPHLSPESIFDFGERHTLCPYELSRLLAAEVELVICDYNYAFDTQAAHAPWRHGEEDSKPVVVIDEAHNLFDRAREALSPFVSRQALKRAKRHVTVTLEEQEPTLATELLLHLQAVEATTMETLLRLDDAVLVDGCAPVELDTWCALADESEELGMRYTRSCWLRQASVRADPVMDVLLLVAQVAELAGAGEPELISYGATRDAARGAGVGVACVNPARRLEARHQLALGTIALSATLSPLPYFRDVLGFGRLAPITTSAPSPFPREHRGVVVVPTVSTRYRDREHSHQEVAKLIDAIVSVQAGRYVAYFPSFAYLSAVWPLLTRPPGELLIQLPGMAPGQRTQLLDRLRTGSAPRLLLAVMGGSLSEGVDLPGDALIGAIVVGPGLPAISFERQLMQHYFEERYEDGYAYAMVYPGLQRVVQAAGRVIRTDTDRGIIALLGERFAHPELGACLPADWYRYAPSELVTSEPADVLAEFWRG